MNATNSKIGFRQFPLGLQLAVLWLCLASLFDIIQAIQIGSDGIGFLLFGVGNVLMAVGIVKRWELVRALAFLWVGIACTARIALLAASILAGFAPMNGAPIDFIWSFGMLGTGLIVINLAIDLGVIYILLRRSTKALFIPPPAPVLAPQEPT